MTQLAEASKSKEAQITTHASGRTDCYSIEKPIVTCDDQFFRRSLFLVSLLSGLLYLTIAAFSSKFNRAEVFFAESAREMIAAANWVTPLFHGQGFFDKPILTYWLIIASFKATAISHLAARAPSIIASVAVIVITACACRRLFGVRSGLLAGMTLGSAFMYISFSALCMSDMLLVLFDTLALVCFYAGIEQEKKRTLCWTLASVAMGFGFLAKGPVAIALPGLFFAAYLTLTKRVRMVKLHHLATFAITVALIGAPWFIMAYKANGLGAITYFFVHENLHRYSGSTYDTHKPIWFMLVSLLGGFAPWSLFLPFILPASINRWRQDFFDRRAQVELYCWLWVAVVIGFFSLSRGKIDYYALPVFPACACLVGLYLTEWASTRNRIAIAGGYLLSLAVIVAGILLGVLTFILPLEPEWACLAVLFAPLSLGIFGVTMVRRGIIGGGYFTGFGGVILLGLVYALMVLPVIQDLQPVIGFSERIAHRQDDSRVAIYTGLERWVDEVTFRTRREPKVLKNAQDLNDFLSAPGSAWLMITREDFELVAGSIEEERLMISQEKPFICGSISPGFILKRAGDLTDGETLLLVTKAQDALQASRAVKPVH